MQTHIMWNYIFRMNAQNVRSIHICSRILHSNRQFN